MPCLKRSGVEVKVSEKGAEREAAAIEKLLSKTKEADGGVKKFNEMASKVIAANSLSTHIDDNEIHDTELVPPRLVTNLWKTVGRLVLWLVQTDGPLSCEFIMLSNLAS